MVNHIFTHPTIRVNTSAFTSNSFPSLRCNVVYQTRRFLLPVHGFSQLARPRNLPHTHTHTHTHTHPATGVAAGGGEDVLFKIPTAFVPVKGDINTRSSFGLCLSSKRLISADPPLIPHERQQGPGASGDKGPRGRPLAHSRWMLLELTF